MAVTRGRANEFGYLAICVIGFRVTMSKLGKSSFDYDVQLYVFQSTGKQPYEWLDA